MSNQPANCDTSRSRRGFFGAAAVGMVGTALSFHSRLAQTARATRSQPAGKQTAHGDSVDNRNDDSEALLKASPLRLELQRPVDSRLLLIEERGIDGCGLFPGAVHVVRNAREVRALSGRLKPGDRLLLAGTDWKGARFTFSGRGLRNAPILVAAQRPGEVVFSGDAGIVFEGQHLVIMDLVFRGVTIHRKGTVVVRLGNGASRPANFCILNRIRIDDCNSPDPADWPNVRAWYLMVRGRDNTVANSVFADMKHYGQMLSASELPDGQLQRLHILNNRFVGRPHLDEQNGYEVIQIGWSGEKARSAASLIEGNIFERCDGEAELITLKASDIVVRRNQFIASQGAVCVRAGNRVLIRGNCFDGRNRARTGGVRLQGWGHVVMDNVFRRLRKPGTYYRWAVSLMAASCENYGDGGDVAGYGRAKDILIAYNRFDACDTRIAVGIYPSPNYPLLPRNIRVIGNVFRDNKRDHSPFDYIAPDPTGELGRTLHSSKNHFHAHPNAGASGDQTKPTRHSKTPTGLDDRPSL